MSNVDMVWMFMLDYPLGWGSHNHSHDYFQIFFILKGSSEMIIAGEKISLQKDNCLLIHPNQPHELLPTTKDTLRIIDTKFYINNKDLEAAVLALPPITKIDQAEYRTILLKARDEWASQAAYSRECACALLEQSLYTLLRNYTDAMNVPSYYSNEKDIIKTSTGLAGAIEDYLESNYYQNITLDMVAEHFRYSKNYLCKLFKEATGLTIIEYCNRLRISKACDIIAYTDHKLSKVCHEVGFTNIHYFSRTFKKIVGYSPMELRNREKSSIYYDVQLHGKFQYRYYNGG